MKQEEDRKIEAAMASIGPAPNILYGSAGSGLLGSTDILRSNELEQVVEEEEEYYVDTAEDEEESDADSGQQIETRKGSSQLVHISRTSPVSPDVNVNVSVNVKTPNRAFIQPSRSTSSISSAGSPTGSIRTAKAEKRLKEKLTKEVSTTELMYNL